MFTGIIQDIGTIEAIDATATGKRLHIKTGLRLQKGASLAVNGVCLTVSALGRAGKKNLAVFDVVEETLSKTNVGKLQSGDHVNLEPSLRLGDALDGHLVLGHIDGVGIVEKMQSQILRVKATKELMHYIALKGSVTINGVSLTVAKTTTQTFSVALVPFTLKHTNLSSLQRGASVNIEVDCIARYIHQCIQENAENRCNARKPGVAVGAVHTRTATRRRRS